MLRYRNCESRTDDIKIVYHKIHHSLLKIDHDDKHTDFGLIIYYDWTVNKSTDINEINLDISEWKISEITEFMKNDKENDIYMDLYINM